MFSDRAIVGARLRRDAGTDDLAKEASMGGIRGLDPGWGFQAPMAFAFVAATMELVEKR